jgi:hypothetical protein
MPKSMRLFTRFVPLLLLGALVVPSTSEARFVVGIGDQHADTFSNPLFQQLGIRDARLIVPYDALSVPSDLAQVDSWIAAARAAGVRPLITFNHSNRSPRKLPSVKAYRRAFDAFRKRYPFIKYYSPWNEANHQSQPTYHRPQWAARYYNVVRSRCRGCKIVALDVLDQGGMIGYVKKFRRFAHGRPSIWGLHNYRDTNRFRTKGTRSLLRAVRGQVWLTETGGIVRFTTNLPYSESRAARATKFMFKLARSNSRIKRLYIYAWKGEARGARFDAGLVSITGVPRPAYFVVRKMLKR